MNQISYELKLLQQSLRREGKKKPPRHCGLCSVSYICNYDVDGFCFWQKEYEKEVVEGF